MTTMPPGGTTAINLALDHRNGVLTYRDTAQKTLNALERVGYITPAGRSRWQVTPAGAAAVKPAVPPHQTGDRITTPDDTHADTTTIGFATYNLRPTTTRAIRITADNYVEVADWIADNIADHVGVEIITPGTQGQGRPRIVFTARHAAPYTGYTGVPVPGVLTVTDTPDGPVYAVHETGDFDAVWEPADS